MMNWVAALLLSIAMATFPDGSQPPEYPETLNGLQTIQQDAADPENPVGEVEIADAEDINFVFRNLVRAVEDIRDFIKKFGLDPDSPNFKDLADAATAILNQIAAAGDGGPSRHLVDRFYGPAKTASSSFFTTSGHIYFLPISIPETANYDAIGVQGAVGSGSIGAAIYDSDDGGFPKTLLKDLGTVATGIQIVSTTAFSQTAGPRYMALITEFGITTDAVNFSPDGELFNGPLGIASLASATPSGLRLIGGTWAAGFPAILGSRPSERSGDFPVLLARRVI